LDKEEILKSCKVSGHADLAPKGSDIVCSAVSILVRTTVQVLMDRAGIKINASAKERGVLGMEIEYAVDKKEFLYAVGEFLIKGLKSISEEYPNHCKVNIRIAEE